MYHYTIHYYVKRTYELTACSMYQNKNFYRGWHAKAGLKFVVFLACVTMNTKTCCPIRQQGSASKIVYTRQQSVNGLTADAQK